MDITTPEGTWYLLANGTRLEMKISPDGKSFKGWLANEGNDGDAVEALSDFSWNPVTRWLEFRRIGKGYFQWYRLSLTYGVMAGRFSHFQDAARPTNTAFIYHVTGWSPTWLDNDVVPRTWNLMLDGKFQAVLRIDRDQQGVLVGRLKVYAPTEELEYDLTDFAWDGETLSFVRSGPESTQSYKGVATGRTIQGTFTQDNDLSLSWTGTRAEVLGFGLGSRTQQPDKWQEAARAQIVNLTEGMCLIDEDIPAVTTTILGVKIVVPDISVPSDRDDNPAAHPPSYTVQHLQFSFSPGSRFDPGNPPPPRVIEAYLATPTTPPPPEGYRAVIALNGHAGSAEQMMSGTGLYWYGDSLARRGFVVLAIDIGHRPSWNYGPVTHPPIVDANYTDSNWEEDGERSFSVRRAIDWLLTQPDVRSDALFITGLSMGGEITTITGALDTRISMVISAGFSPDMYVMDNHGNHPCYKWDYADIHEYLDVSDYQALIAPRPLIVETGLLDETYSSMDPPWASDKQVLRRAYAAYGARRENLIHYLHYDEHRWHAGDLNPTDPEAPRGLNASTITEPQALGDFRWQTSNGTTLRSATLYSLMNELLP